MSWFKFWKKDADLPAAKVLAKPAARQPGSAGSTAMQNPFHAVEIKAGPDCCQAAKAVEKQRFLSRGTPLPPQVPMRDCDRPMECSCRYIHYDDRRTEVRRNVWNAGFATDHGATHFAAIRGEDKVRTGKRGRRKDD